MDGRTDGQTVMTKLIVFFAVLLTHPKCALCCHNVSIFVFSVILKTSNHYVLTQHSKIGLSYGPAFFPCDVRTDGVCAGVCVCVC